MPVPSHNIGRRRSSRGPRASTATASTAHSSSTWNLVSPATPTTRPSTGSRRSSPHPDPADQQPHQHQPLDRLHRVGREPVAGERDPQRGGLRPGGQHLRAAVAAELAGDQRGHDDRRGGGDDGRQPQRDDRTRRHAVHQRGEHGDDRRLVGGTPVEVVAADGQHVHLVEPVPAADNRGDELRHPHRGGDRQHGRPRRGRYGRRVDGPGGRRAPDAQRRAIRDCTSPSCT